LINRGIEEFLRSTYGQGLVQAVAQDGQPPVGMVAPMGAGFGVEALHQAAMQLSKPFAEMVEDLGAWMTRIEPVRRLLRFSGRDFKDFLLRLEELPGRAHLVLPSLQLPRLQIDTSENSVWVKMLDPDDHWRFVLVGLIRGMADDYGALCLITTDDLLIRIDICDEKFTEGRMFTLHGIPYAEAGLTG
jgi:hypothetical protein